MFARSSVAPILRPEQLTAERLEQLRKIPGILKSTPLASHLEFEGIQIPRGAITEISGPPGSGKTQWTLRLISQTFQLQDSLGSDRHSPTMERIGTVGASGGPDGAAPRDALKVGLKVGWIEDTFTANPRGFAEEGVDLRQFLFIEGGRDSLWAAHQILRSRLFDIVVLWVRESILSVQEPSVELRKLQLSAEQAGTPVLLLSSQPRPTGVNWPVSLQISMNPQTRQAELLQLSPRSEEVRHERSRFSFNRLRAHRRLHSA
jgi:RecA/RadA recombinase